MSVLKINYIFVNAKFKLRDLNIQLANYLKQPFSFPQLFGFFYYETLQKRPVLLQSN